MAIRLSFCRLVASSSLLLLKDDENVFQSGWFRGVPIPEPNLCTSVPDLCRLFHELAAKHTREHTGQLRWHEERQVIGKFSLNFVKPYRGVHCYYRYRSKSLQRATFFGADLQHFVKLLNASYLCRCQERIKFTQKFSSMVTSG